MDKIFTSEFITSGSLKLRLYGFCRLILRYLYLSQYCNLISLKDHSKKCIVCCHRTILHQFYSRDFKLANQLLGKAPGSQNQ